MSAFSRGPCGELLFGIIRPAASRVPTRAIRLTFLSTRSFQSTGHVFAATPARDDRVTTSSPPPTPPSRSYRPRRAGTPTPARNATLRPVTRSTTHPAPATETALSPEQQQQQIQWDGAASSSSSSSSSSSLSSSSSSESSSPVSSMPSQLATRYSYARMFARLHGRRGQPTVLYEAPSHFWHKLQAWIAGTMCFGEGAFLVGAFSREVQAQGVAEWVAISYNVSGALLAMMGMYWILRAKDIVKTVRVLPATKTVTAAAQEHQKEVGDVLADMKMEVTVKSVLPFMPPRTMVAPIMEVSVATVVSPDRSWQPLSNVERMELKRRLKAEAEARRAYEMSHLMTAPFRHFWSGAKVAASATFRFLAGGGFGTLEVAGRTLKLDVVHGWHLDEGRALEKLCGRAKDEAPAVDSEKVWQRRLFRK